MIDINKYILKFILICVIVYFLIVFLILFNNKHCNCKKNNMKLIIILLFLERK